MPFRPHRKPRRETPPTESRAAKPQRPIRRADSEPVLRRERPSSSERPPAFQREERSESKPPRHNTAHHNDHDDRASDALHYAVGRRAALELLKDASALKRIEKIYIAHGVQGGQIGEILHLARKNKVTTGELDRGKFRELERRTSQHTDSQGVIVLLAQRGYQELEDVVTFSNERSTGGEGDRSSFAPPLLIALDGVEDPHNIGAIIRSAEASGANAILLPKRGAVITPAVYKTSAGAANNLAIVKYGNLEQTIRLMQEEYGVACYGLAGEAEETIYDVDLTGPICFVTGSEEKGLHRLVRERCEKIVKIPLAGKTASLNASVASAVALFEAVRQRANAYPTNASQADRK